MYGITIYHKEFIIMIPIRNTKAFLADFQEELFLFEVNINFNGFSEVTYV